MNKELEGDYGGGLTMVYIWGRSVKRIWTGGTDE